MGMDSITVTYMIIMFIWGTTVRASLALGLFELLRGVLQSQFLMTKPQSYIWSYPGIHSFTVPYFDTSDFYFSGHVGSSTIFASEYVSMKWRKWTIYATCVVCDVWISFTFLSAHYVIDFFSGYVFARLLCRFSEKNSYYFDVKLLGYRK